MPTKPAPRLNAPFEVDDAVTRLRDLAGQQTGAALRAVVLSVPAPLENAAAGQPDSRPPFPVGAAGDLAAVLTDRHGLPVYVENDANLAAIGERHHGRTQGPTDFIYLRMMNGGFGAGIIVNGALVRGAHGYGGELAHLQMDSSGPLCACGGRGCLRSQIQSLVVDTAQAAYPHPVTFADLAVLAAGGDPGAARILTDIGRVLGRPLAYLCTFLDPDHIVVDNSIGAAVTPIVAGIRDAFATGAPPVIARNLTITVSELGPLAEQRGALELPREHARTGRPRAH